MPILDAANPRSGSKAIVFEDEPREIVGGGFLAYGWDLSIRGLGARFCEFLVCRFLAYRQIDRARACARIETIMFDRNGVQSAVVGDC